MAPLAGKRPSRKVVKPPAVRPSASRSSFASVRMPILKRHALIAHEGNRLAEGARKFSIEPGGKIEKPFVGGGDLDHAAHIAGDPAGQTFSAMPDDEHRGLGGEYRLALVERGLELMGPPLGSLFLANKLADDEEGPAGRRPRQQRARRRSGGHRQIAPRCRCPRSLARQPCAASQARTERDAPSLVEPPTNVLMGAQSPRIAFPNLPLGAARSRTSCDACSRAGPAGRITCRPLSGQIYKQTSGAGILRLGAQNELQ